MKLTRDQIIKRNAQAPDGWRYDWKFAVIHGEHTLTRRVAVDGSHFLVARVWEFSANALLFIFQLPR